MRTARRPAPSSAFPATPWPGYSSAAVERKGVFRLLPAFGAARRAGAPDRRRRGRAQARARALARELGIGERTHFPGVEATCGLVRRCRRVRAADPLRSLSECGPRGDGLRAAVIAQSQCGAAELVSEGATAWSAMRSTRTRLRAPLRRLGASRAQERWARAPRETAERFGLDRDGGKSWSRLYPRPRAAPQGQRL